MTRRGSLLFAALSIIWGIPYLLIRVAVRAVDPAVLVFCRTGMGAVLLLPLAAARGELRLGRRWRWLVAYTVVELAVPWVLLSTAEEHLTSSLSGLLVASVPLVGALLAWERLGLRQALGLVVGLAGVGALVGFDVGSADLGYVAMVGVVAVGYAAGPLILARRLSDVPGLGVVAASLGLCAAGYAPVALTRLPARWPDAHVLAAIATLGVVCTAVAFIVFFHLIAEVGPLRATVITYVNPAVAVVLGVTFQHDPFTVATAVGFVLILGGSFLATRASVVAEADGGDRVIGALVEHQIGS